MFDLDDTTNGEYQFIRKIWAARIQLQTKKTVIVKNKPIKAVAWSIQDWLDELMRIEGHCNHVEKPQKPIILYASSPEIFADPHKVLDVANEWAASQKTITGRAHQINSPVMACVVVSLYRHREEEWPAYKERSINWIKEKYGDRLRLIVEHEDESNPHFHAMLVPLYGTDKDGKPFSEPFGAVHEGYGDSRSARRDAIEKLGKNEVSKKTGKTYTKGAKTGAAYIDAMKAYQDKFHEEVAKDFGLERKGALVKSLSHGEAIRQKQLKAAAKKEKEAEELKNKVYNEYAELMKKQRLAREEDERLKRQSDLLNYEERRREQKHIQEMRAAELERQAAATLMKEAERIGDKVIAKAKSVEIKEERINQYLESGATTRLKLYEDATVEASQLRMKDMAAQQRIANLEKQLSEKDSDITYYKGRVSFLESTVNKLESFIERAISWVNDKDMKLGQKINNAFGVLMAKIYPRDTSTGTKGVDLDIN